MEIDLAAETRRDRVCQLGAALAVHVPDEFLIASDHMFESVVSALESSRLGDMVRRSLVDSGLTDEKGRAL